MSDDRKDVLLAEQLAQTDSAARNAILSETQKADPKRADRLRKLVKNILAVPVLLLSVLLIGCGSQEFVEPYRPMFPDLVYPDGVSARQFWTQEAQFWNAAAGKELTENERAMLGRVYDYRSLFQQREEQIRVYNAESEAMNRKNGYLDGRPRAEITTK